MKTRLIHGIMLGLALCLVCTLLAADEPGDGRFEFSRAGYWSVPDSPRHVSSINAEWEFSLDEFKTVRKVNLPHSIDEGEIGFAASGGVNRRQPAWYRRALSWKGGSTRQFLHFEAIMGKCRIAVNGQKVADPAVWTPETPNLHLLRVDVEKAGRIVDSVGVKFGIRDFSIDMQGVVLNGKRYPTGLRRGLSPDGPRSRRG